MPARSSPISEALRKTLRDLGQKLRSRRKRLGISVVTAAEAAGMSRITFHRIERGEPSVSMGAYLSALSAMGLELGLSEARRKNEGARQTGTRLPDQIRIASYPELKRLAWQLKGEKALTPKEALALYERNWRHLDVDAMNARERELLRALLNAFGRERLLV